MGEGGGGIEHVHAGTLGDNKPFGNQAFDALAPNSCYAGGIISQGG